jgi:hypothetical protein
MQPHESSIAAVLKTDESGTVTPKNGAERLIVWASRNTIIAIIATSFLAICLNCWPVIFGGKSFVSPSSVAAAVYSWWPPVPGVENLSRSNQNGSDTGAIMWAGVPWAYVQSRALFDNGELPLWNRYSGGGQTLIGQGISQIGDPLHLIVLLGRGSAVSWDIKYLVAKFLLCVGFGLLMFRLTRSLSTAVVYVFLSAFCGVYFYIYNHPSFFVFAYSPWILLTGISMLDRDCRRSRGWFMGWLVSNLGCFNAGMLSVSVVLIGGLNLTALVYSISGCKEWAARKIVVVRMALGSLIFLGLSAPVWISFIGALDGAFSLHMEVQVDQLPASSALGIFDDIFYRMLSGFNGVSPVPGCSLLVLVGCILCFARWKQLAAKRIVWISLSAIAIWGGFVFGWVPASLIAKIPLLNRVGHIHTDFSYLVIVHLFLLSAYGFSACSSEKSSGKALKDHGILTFIIAVIYVIYYFSNKFDQVRWAYVLLVTLSAIGASLLYDLSRSGDTSKRFYWCVPAFLLAIASVYRFGYYSSGDSDNRIVLGERVRLDAPSKSVEKVKSLTDEPFRVVGMQNSFIGDYSAAYGLEDIRSAAPLLSGSFSEVVRNYPGINPNLWGWVVDVVNPVQAQALLNMLNVRFLLAHPSTNVQEEMDYKIIDRDDFLVLENLQVWPRAFFSAGFVLTSTNEEFIQNLYNNGTHPFIALDPGTIKAFPVLAALETRKIYPVTPASNYGIHSNSTSFDIQAASPGVVCLTEGQAKGFIVKVNGKKEKLLTVNRAFKGVYLADAGKYRIEFVYRPYNWTLSYVLLLVAVVPIFCLYFNRLGRSLFANQSE